MSKPEDISRISGGCVFVHLYTSLSSFHPTFSHKARWCSNMHLLTMILSKKGLKKQCKTLQKHADGGICVSRTRKVVAPAGETG